MLASALLKRKRGMLGLLDGAVVGALSAVVFSTLITILASVMLMLGVGLVGLEQFMHQLFPGYEYNVEGAIFALVFGVFFAFVFHLIPSLVLCAVGGILGAKILE